MRHFGFLLSFAIILAAGCGTLSQTPEQKQEERERVALLVQQKLDAMQYVIDVNYMIPIRGGARSLTSDYFIAVDGSRINSHLPYFGVAYTAVYGGGKVLTFEDEILDYYDSGFRNDSRKVMLKTYNGEDTIIYTMTIFDNGTATINVQCRNREEINYRGVLNVDK